MPSRVIKILINQILLPTNMLRKHTKEPSRMAAISTISHAIAQWWPVKMAPLVRAVVLRGETHQQLMDLRMVAFRLRNRMEEVAITLNPQKMLVLTKKFQKALSRSMKRHSMILQSLQSNPMELFRVQWMSKKREPENPWSSNRRLLWNSLNLHPWKILWLPEQNMNLPKSINKTNTYHRMISSCLR